MNSVIYHDVSIPKDFFSYKFTRPEKNSVHHIADYNSEIYSMSSYDYLQHFD